MVIDAVPRPHCVEFAIVNSLTTGTTRAHRMTFSCEAYCLHQKLAEMKFLTFVQGGMNTHKVVLQVITKL